MKVDTFTILKGNNSYKNMKKCLILESNQECVQGLLKLLLIKVLHSLSRVVIPAMLDYISVHAHFTRFLQNLETVKKCT